MPEIEKNVPVPAAKKARKYPFDQLEIGDSLFFHGEKYHSRPRDAARIYGRRTGKKFMARCVEGGIRIWRKY